MTSAIGVTPPNRRAAFTLIEVALAMFIVVLVIGIGLPFATGMGREGRLREPAGELKKFALTARRRAVTHQRTVEILLENNRYILQDAAAEEESKLLSESEKKGAQIDSYTLPKSVSYSIKHWDETQYAPHTDARWRFLPTGLCEPITVRFNREEDFLEFSFNPLTAQTEDESFLFR